MALACLQCPDQSTIAAVVASLHAELLALFGELLLVCEAQQWLGGPVFALDGLKLSSNASQAWRGTCQALPPNQATVETTIAQLLAEHQQVDGQDRQGDGQAEGGKAGEVSDTALPAQEAPAAAVHEGGSPVEEPEEKACHQEASPDGDRQEGEGAHKTGSPRSSSPLRSGGPKRSRKHPQRARQQRHQQKRARRLKRLRHQAERRKRWLATHKPRRGRQGHEIKCNLTDAESAKMATSHGVMQGYTAQALVDARYQVIVTAAVVGDGQEAQPLIRMLERAKATLPGIGQGAD
jgi:hypothetical protein